MLALSAVVWALDQATKQWALHSLTPGEVRPWLGEILRLTLVFNPGAAFSLGTGITPVFTAAMAGVSIAILVVIRRLRSPLWALALGLLLGGALGNLTDRLFRPPGFARGHVVDFLMLPNWPVFNIADSCIVTAAALIVLAAFRGIDLDHPRPDDESSQACAADDAARQSEGGEPVGPRSGTTVAPRVGASDTESPEVPAAHVTPGDSLEPGDGQRPARGIGESDGAGGGSARG